MHPDIPDVYHCIGFSIVRHTSHDSILNDRDIVSPACYLAVEERCALMAV
jgi:hypothetical protein